MSALAQKTDGTAPIGRNRKRNCRTRIQRRSGQRGTLHLGHPPTRSRSFLAYRYCERERRGGSVQYSGLSAFWHGVTTTSDRGLWLPLLRYDGNLQPMQGVLYLPHRYLTRANELVNFRNAGLLGSYENS